MHEVIKLAMKNDYIVEKRNVLNELRANNMTLQELRFFSIYLSKINSRDISTRKVRFSLEDFRKIMELEYRVNIEHTKSIINSLLCKVVYIPLDDGGYTAFQLFTECTIAKDTQNEWYIEIDAHDKALPLMFEFKDKYFTYELWNALRLKSANQLRMYEILKQYERIGERVISVDELRELLGIDKEQYKYFTNFKVRVLDSCQQALEEYTDIKFIYEPVRRKGRGGKVYTLKFKISKNDRFIDQISLDEFIDKPENSDTPMFENEYLEFLAGACGNEFNEAEMQVLYNIIVKIIPLNDDAKIERYNYLKGKYDELKMRAVRTEIKNRFGYLKAIIEADIIAME